MRLLGIRIFILLFLLAGSCIFGSPAQACSFEKSEWSLSAITEMAEGLIWATVSSTSSNKRVAEVKVHSYVGDTGMPETLLLPSTKAHERHLRGGCPDISMTFEPNREYIIMLSEGYPSMKLLYPTSSTAFLIDEQGELLKSDKEDKEKPGALLEQFALSKSSVVRKPDPQAVQRFSKQFEDVPKRHWAYNEIYWGLTEGGLSGVTEADFAPDAPITYAEFLAMLLRTYSQVKVPEAKVGDPWERGYVEYARQMNWPVAKEPHQPIVRGDAAHWLAGMLGLGGSSPSDSIRSLLREKLIEGREAPSVEGFRPQDSLTRAEAIVLIHRVYTEGLALWKYRGEHRTTGWVRAEMET